MKHVVVWVCALGAAHAEIPASRQRAEAARAAIRRLETEPLGAAERAALIGETRASCADLQLGALDLWYGDSIVTSARLRLLEGDWKGARALLLDQAETLWNIEKNLAANKIPVSAISPVAGCRFVLAETYWIEHEETGALEPAVAALKHYYNAHVKYGDSEWGPPAGEKAERAKALLESRGKLVRVQLGPHRDAYVATKFKLGARLVAEESYAAALEPLETALNVFPESSRSVAAARNLGVARAFLGEEDRALATVEYLGERFGADTNAATAALAIARAVLDSGDASAGDAAFDLYLAGFPNDARRADILSYLAWKAYKEADETKTRARFAALEAELRKQQAPGARLEKAVFVQATRPADAARLDAFLKEFPESDLAPAALGAKAEALLIAGDFDAAFNALEELGETHPDAPAAKGALGGLILAAVEAERYDVAERVLARMLEDKAAHGPETYRATGERLLAAGRPALAARAFQALPPDSEQGLYGVGRARFAEERWDAAVVAMTRLLKAYPRTRRFRAARLTRARALVKLERTDEAIADYGEVLALGPDLAVSFELAGVLPRSEDQLAAYQRIALLADPAKKKNLPLIEASVLASLPLCAELNRDELMIQNCDQFDRLFPQHENSPRVAEYRKAVQRASAH